MPHRGGSIARRAHPVKPRRVTARKDTAFLFDLDGTLIDSVYQHVIAWREALEEAASSLASGRSTAASA